MGFAGLPPASLQGLVHDQWQNRTRNEVPSSESVPQSHPSPREGWMQLKMTWHVGHSHNDVMWKMQKDKSESFGNLSSIRQTNRYWHLCLLRLYLVNNWCISMCFYSEVTLKFQSPIFPDILQDQKLIMGTYNQQRVHISKTWGEKKVRKKECKEKQKVTLITIAGTRQTFSSHWAVSK